MGWAVFRRLFMILFAPALFALETNIVEKRMTADARTLKQEGERVVGYLPTDTGQAQEMTLAHRLRYRPSAPGSFGVMEADDGRHSGRIKERARHHWHRAQGHTRR
jgi:hypothetical protein